MLNWIHQLLNPHCQHCIDLEESKFERNNFCNTCESLKNENAFLREQNKLLLDKIINPSIPNEPIINDESLKPLTNFRKPFNVIRQELEAADRQKAKILDNRLKETAAKSDNSITNDEGKIDPIKVEQELENLNKEIKNG